MRPSRPATVSPAALSRSTTQQVSRVAALHTTDTSCAADATRLKLGAGWLDVPEPVAAVLQQHLRNRGNMTTAANPDSPWLFPGQLADDHRS
jgi:hypothetical protein